MFSAWILLLLNSLFFSLRISEGGGSFPKPLKAEEERACLERYAQGDMEARNTLIEHNLRLVAHIVKKYYTQASNQDDLISIGTIGLIKGISTFKVDKNVRLATYASRCIENAIPSQWKHKSTKKVPFILRWTMITGLYTMVGENTTIMCKKPGDLKQRRLVQMRGMRIHVINPSSKKGGSVWIRRLK